MSSTSARNLAARRTEHDPVSAHLRASRVGARATAWWAAVLIAAALWFLTQLVGGLVSGVIRGTWADGSTASTAVGSALLLAPVLVIAYSVRIIGVWAWTRRYERRGFRTVGFPAGGAVNAGRGAVIGLVAFGAVVAILAAFGEIRREVPAGGFVGAAAVSGVLIMLVGWAVQGVAEEVLYRGFLLQSLARHGVGVAVAASALLFAAAHPGAYNSPLALANLVVFGVLTGLWALREGGLWGVSGFHVAWNWAQGNLFGLSVSGQSVPGGSLLAVQTETNSVLAGGEFGVEASLVTTILMAIACVVLARPRSGPPRRAVVTTRASIPDPIGSGPTDASPADSGRR